MKNRSIEYSEHQYSGSSEPRYVVSIEFSPASFEYFSSHSGIADIPGGTIESVIMDWSSVSQSFDPETGASKIGSLSVQLGDVAGAVTDAFQARLVAGTGVRGKRLRFYKGFKGMSFDDFELKWTQDVHEASEDHAKYVVSCSDLQRAMRTEIFQLKSTILDATLSATASTATVADTSEFVMVEHGSSYSHGPSATWGYFRLDDEVIGYTGKTAITFTGLARGLFNTLAVEHVVDPADDPERRPEIEEYVYLEMPIVKLIKAIQTGELHNQGPAVLPDHWHSDIPSSLLDDSQYTGIGPDLWDPANDAVGLIARFTDISAISAKRFIESECYLLAQVFSPVLADGRLGLKRFTPALARAAHLVTLNEQNVVKHSSLKHAMRAVFNRIVLNWSWVSGEFRRQTIKLDTNSIAKHGQAPIKTYNFRGLATNIATKSVLDQRFDAIKDRFSAPPVSMDVDVSKALERMELADVVRVQLPNVRDMTADTVNPIDRAFEIRQIRESRKRLSFSLSGSTAESVPVAPDVNALPDAYYNQEGTELSTVVTIVAGVTQTGTFTLVGDPALASSVFYYVGNLTIAADTILQLDDNVQLRVRGFVTLNGDITGVGRGLAGVSDGVTVGDAPSGLLGFFGATAGGDGATHDGELDAYRSRRGNVVRSYSAAPHLNLNVDGNTLDGLPTDLRGCSGGPGEKLVDENNVQIGAGGTGGDGGAGLMIVCRGMSFGGGASIDLSGDNGLSALEQTLGTRQFFGGGGGGGAPGAFYILLDGDRLVPDVAPIFSALGGNTPIDGIPIPRFLTFGYDLSLTEHTGFKDDTRRLSDVDWGDGAFRVQFVPLPETPVEDLPDEDFSIYYILATSGNAIHNSIGNLTLEAHRVTAGTDELLSTGTIKLFDPADQEITLANGYVTGSDGYTGILDSGDITGDIVVTLKDGAAGTPLDTITLVDIADGAGGGPGADGADAVYGVVEPENGLAWTRATNAGAWTPSQETTDLDCTFYQAGVEVARIARRVTLNTTDGTLTAAAIAHKGGDLNTSRVNVTLIGNGSTAETVQFDYSFGGEDSSVSETASTSQAGDDGFASVPAFTPGRIGGQSDLVFTLNEVVGGTPNIGEIRVVGSVFEHPDGSTIVPDVSDFAIHTRFEGAIAGKFYIMFSAVAGETRFGGSVSDWGAGDDTRFISVVHDVTNDWRAVDNASVFYGFTPLSTDCIIAVCDKLSTAGGSGIESIVPMVAGIDGDDGPTGADGDDGVLHYLTNEAHVIPANFDGAGYDTAFTGAGGTHKLFEGTSDETTNATHSVLTATKNGLTMAIVAGTGVYSLSGTAWSTDIETFTLRAVFNSINYDKEYSIAKAKQGTDGGCAIDTFTLINVKDLASNPADAGFRVHSDGTIDEREGGGFVNKETWIGACANTEYECQLTKISGVTPTGPALITWHLCSTTRSWELNTSGSDETFVGTLKIRRISDDKVVGSVSASITVTGIA